MRVRGRCLPSKTFEQEELEIEVLYITLLLSYEEIVLKGMDLVIHQEDFEDLSSNNISQMKGLSKDGSEGEEITNDASNTPKLDETSSSSFGKRKNALLLKMIALLIAFKRLKSLLKWSEGDTVEAKETRINWEEKESRYRSFAKEKEMQMPVGGSPKQMEDEERKPNRVNDQPTFEACQHLKLFSLSQLWAS
ncbi:hypothetical protein JRO89_XS10G0028500 [Xanthoceras sorbifolium]|uniref:Uncharacterized protein n=1 Tax=Xanthoceras sorbifolium TaxID=99658 RepID=A0ABQ8HHE7_9ROSI|nr:hypothetical protein JRO89_XS10G0028500 [Xanthoceras sorbifolium]